MATYELNRYFECDKTLEEKTTNVVRYVKTKEYNGIDRRIAASNTALRYNKKNELIYEGDAAFERRVLKAKFYDKAGVELNESSFSAASKRANPFVITNAIGAVVSDSRDLRSVGAGSAFLSQEILNFMVDKNKPVDENEIKAHFKNVLNRDEVIQEAIDCLLNLKQLVKHQ